METIFENRGLRIESQDSAGGPLHCEVRRSDGSARAFAAAATSAPTNHGKPKKLDRRIPGHRNLPIAGCGLFDMCKRRERVVNALHQHLLGHQHVVDLTAHGLRLHRIVIEEGMPAGIAHKQKRRMGQVALDVDLARAGCNRAVAQTPFEKTWSLKR
jgi:hypothetical protein